MSVILGEGANGLPMLSLAHPSGSTAELYLDGAHLTSWIPAGGVDALFLSRAAEMARGKAIRGGVPIIFPQFAKRGPLPKHGFARVVRWQWLQEEAGADATRATLELVDSEETRASWPHRFRARVTVDLAERTLAQQLSVESTDHEPFSFTAALHTYFRIGDLRDAAIVGLGGAAFEDHSPGREGVRETTAGLVVTGEIDRIYVGAPSTLQIADGRNARTLELRFDGFEDVVVWNPDERGAAALPDMEADEYRQMICVEAAQVSRPVGLEPGERWEGRQRVEVVPGG
ncbi:MAG: D-hexose-6-phosphate mutarotase [Gemmatimonadetes bacterium]|nr:D-hexose-6-phosphate mutarotase [Gemmatimonadota bacterium]